MLNCPRCRETLKAGEKDYFCPKNHGALLTLGGFQNRTNRGFTQWFFASWLRRGNKRTISCPACSSKMVQLNIEARASFDLDGCPHCFAVWLDAGEEQLLKDLFHRHLEADQIRDLNSDQHETLGRLILQHDQVIRRYTMLEKLARVLNTRLRFGYFGYRSPIYFDTKE